MLCMNNDFENTQHNEDLQAENEFLKMKLMLERGAVFGSAEDKVLPPEIENTFLKTQIAIKIPGQFKVLASDEGTDRAGFVLHGLKLLQKSKQICFSMEKVYLPFKNKNGQPPVFQEISRYL